MDSAGKMMLLRVQLFTAMQQADGDDLAEFWRTIQDVQSCGPARGQGEAITYPASEDGPLTAVIMPRKTWLRALGVIDAVDDFPPCMVQLRQAIRRDVDRHADLAPARLDGSIPDWH